MNKIADAIIKHKLSVLLTFLLITVICVFLQAGVQVNYILSDYLPAQAPSTVALHVMEDEFQQATPNVRVYIPDVTIMQALQYKEKIQAVPGVDAVSWLDNVINLQVPLQYADPGEVAAWYKDGGALFQVTADTGHAAETVHALQDAAGIDGAVSGQLVDLASAQAATKQEISQIMIFLVPLILVILLLTTRSWFEPVLFLLAIGASILINAGTNIFLGEVSFITQSVSSVLQLAVSMDYAIFLLNRFSRNRDEGMDVRQAMHQAMVKASSSIIASALTTVFGFLALVFMRFRLGPDLGLVLAKGIVFSLLSVMVFLPVVAMFTHKLIEKTHHRSFMPKLGTFSRMIYRVGIPVMILVSMIIVPCYLGQRNNNFLYGTSGLSGVEREQRDTQTIDAKFGRSVQLALLVPKGDMGSESLLDAQLTDIPQVTSIISYANLVSAQIPVEFLPQEDVSSLISEHYSRFILSVDTPDEGDEAFAVVDQVKHLAYEYYGDSYYLCGTSANIYDMKTTITVDNTLVNLIAIIAIGLVLLLTFRSLSLPLILLFTIESSIWINLSIPYFSGTSLNFIGFLVISTVQLGATVDYGILFVRHYLDNRALMGKKQAILQTLSETAVSILTPASILAAAGFTIGVISTNSIVSQLGIVLGRGAALSAAMVLLFLPTALTTFDQLIEKTTLQLHFKEVLK